MIKARSRAKWTNREGLSEYAFRWNWVEDTSGSGFTAVLRVKDEARSLPWVLPGVLRSVQQTIVVDNGSTDGTPEVALGVAEELGLSERLRVLSYPFAVSRCGPEHLRTYPDSVHSLTYFYNWSFSHVLTRYALKWDGDMVLTPEGERVLRDLAWQLAGYRRHGEDVSLPRLCGERARRLRRPRNNALRAVGLAEHIGAYVHQVLRLGAHKARCRLALQAPDWMCFELKWLDQTSSDTGPIRTSSSGSTVASGASGSCSTP